jgi:hypothetical protein
LTAPFDEDLWISFQCMHLVYKALDKNPVPQTLPPQLVPPSKRKKTGPVVGGVQVLPAVGARDSPVQRADSPAVSQRARVLYTILQLSLQ